jgi:hypothetical protein
MELKLRYPNIIPAITIVELCNNDETGVGALIAEINQDENGKIADFVKKITININSTNSINIYEKITIYKLNVINEKV